MKWKLRTGRGCGLHYKVLALTGSEEKTISSRLRFELDASMINHTVLKHPHLN